jgi:hypothetical protein
MKVETLAKDGGSGDDGCPSIYVAEDGQVVVQGQVADSHTLGELKNPLPGETAVLIAPEVVLAAAAKLRARR